MSPLHYWFRLKPSFRTHNYQIQSDQKLIQLQYIHEIQVVINSHLSPAFCFLIRNQGSDITYVKSVWTSDSLKSNQEVNPQT